MSPSTDSKFSNLRQMANRQDAAGVTGQDMVNPTLEGYGQKTDVSWDVVGGDLPSATGTGQPNPLAYPKSQEPFSDELFQHPTAEYRGCPLWAWNSKLDKNKMLRQIDCFEEMGMGGFHMHVRTGLDTDYMGSEFMEIVRACVDYAESKGMLACLYDDDRWPSGAAGGKVTQQYPEHMGKHILFTPRPYGTVELGGGCSPSSARACRSENGHLVAKYVIKLDENGCLASSRVIRGEDTATTETLGPDEPDEGDAVVWYAYLETNPPSEWFNGQTYVDTLSSQAMARFIESTHEIYKATVGDKFGTVVPCIFTDEPQFATKTQLSTPQSLEDLFLPWTDDLPETFAAAAAGKESAAAIDQGDLIAGLPQLFWNLPGDEPSGTRYRFHDHVCERFVTAFLDQLGGWCRANGLLLNGHMMEEPTLWSQTTALGEAMRCYRGMGVPGIDLLNDAVEYNTAKQASSVARQRGLRACMSELYGCTHWYFSFEGHKGCGDWQAALGVTFRVPHLAWLSMAGEGKRDYPASIGRQSPWHREYRHVEDHFARVGVALTRGRPVTRVAVVHPIESFWLCFGPDGAGDEPARRDAAFADLTRWLLQGLVDFDFISESLLPDQYGGVDEAAKTLAVGACRYEVVVVPDLRTVRRTTLDILLDFARRGGDVVCAGRPAVALDGAPGGERLPQLFRYFRRVPWKQGEIHAALHRYRDLDVWTASGPAETLLYQMRQDGDQRYVFLCNRDRDNAVSSTISLVGTWDVDLLDTITGEIKRLAASTRQPGRTRVRHRFEGCGSLLLRLSKPEDEAWAAPWDLGGEAMPAPTPPSEPSGERLRVELEEVSLSEPNVLLLDYAEYKIDDGEWVAETEVLRIDNEIRDRLRLPRKGGAWRQPWTVPEAERSPSAHVTLRFAFCSETDLDAPAELALEDIEGMRIRVNGVEVDLSTAGKHWWVDEDIRAHSLPAALVRKGANSVQLDCPFGILTNLERIYLLGRFKVRLDGHKPTLLPWGSSRLGWGDITTQGLPFYVGNLVYQCTVTSQAPGTATLCVPHFSSPVLTVNGPNGAGKRHLAFQPRTLPLERLEAGENSFTITAFGNRYNGFGHIHLPPNVGGCWPDMWRTGGWAWTDDYALKPVGVLEGPTLLLLGKAEEEGAALAVVPTGDVEVAESRLSSEWVVVRRPMYSHE